MTNQNGRLRYRHAGGVSCGCTNKSVRCDDLHEDFGRLLKLLTVNDEAQHLLTELAIGADIVQKQAAGGVDLETQKQEAIALCKRRIDAAVTLYKEGRIDIDEYHDIVTRNEREIAHWQMRTSEMEQIAVELAMCMDVVNKVADLWDTASPEDRQGMARNLFEYLVYDLDTRRITDFRLKPWADRFLVLRMELYREEYPDLAAKVEAALGEKESPPTDESQGNDMPHRGFGGANRSKTRDWADFRPCCPIPTLPRTRAA
ncbi:MAG: hypothetical protein KBH93_02665 [Anaerolineae bacterium]|nr:hypothetical protein [Anaerolineae bacterium]